MWRTSRGEYPNLCTCRTAVCSGVTSGLHWNRKKRSILRLPMSSRPRKVSTRSMRSHTSINRQWQAEAPRRGLYLRSDIRRPPTGQSVPQLRWWMRMRGTLLIHPQHREVRGRSLKRRRITAPTVRERLVAEILEHQVHLQLVLLCADHLDDRLQVVAVLPRDADGVALDRALHLELAVLDHLHDGFRLLHLDALDEAEHLRDVLSALFDGAVLEAAQGDAALGHLLHQNRPRRLQPLLGGAADLQTLLRRGDLLQRGLGALEVVALVDLLLRLLEGVIDLLLVHLADDVEARHVTSPGRPGAPSAASPRPSSRRSARRGGGPLPPFRDRCAARDPARRAHRAQPGGPGRGGNRRARRRPCPEAPARAPPRRSCGPGRRGTPACPSPRGAGDRGARPRRRRRTRHARRDRAAPPRPHWAPPRRSRPCATPRHRRPRRSRRQADSLPQPRRSARVRRACGIS